MMMSKVMARFTDGPDFNVLLANGVAAGQEVFHVHYHFIPRAPRDNLGYKWKQGLTLPPKPQIERFMSKVHGFLSNNDSKNEGRTEVIAPGPASSSSLT